MLISELLRKRPNEALLFITMSDLADGECILETTQKELTECTGMSRDQVRTAVKNLVKLGVVEVEVFNRKNTEHPHQNCSVPPHQFSRVTFLYRADCVLITNELPHQIPTKRPHQKENETEKEKSLLTISLKEKDKEKETPPKLKISPPKGGLSVNNAHAREKFIPPSVDEIQAYLDERGITDIDAQAFFDFYQTNGWVQGKSCKPIKSWKHCVGTWLHKMREDQKIYPTKGMNQVERANYEQQQRIAEYARGIAGFHIESISSNELPFQ